MTAVPPRPPWEDLETEATQIYHYTERARAHIAKGIRLERKFKNRVRIYDRVLRVDGEIIPVKVLIARRPKS